MAKLLSDAAMKAARKQTRDACASMRKIFLDLALMESKKKAQ